LAEIYEVETKELYQAVKRNIMRSPKDFMLKLSGNEFSELVTICDRSRDTLTATYTGGNGTGAVTCERMPEKIKKTARDSQQQTH